MRLVPHSERGQVAKVFFESNGIRSLYFANTKATSRFKKEETGTVLCPSMASFSFKIKSVDSMPKVDSCDIQEGFLALGHDPVQWGRAGYLMEITEQMLAPAHAEPEVYALLTQAMALLAQGQGDGVLLRAFELRLLKLQGLLGDPATLGLQAALAHFQSLLERPLNDLPELSRDLQRDFARPFWEQRRILGLKPTKSAQFLKQFQHYQ